MQLSVSELWTDVANQFAEARLLTVGVLGTMYPEYRTNQDNCCLCHQVYDSYRRLTGHFDLLIRDEDNCEAIIRTMFDNRPKDTHWGAYWWSTKTVEGAMARMNFARHMAELTKNHYVEYYDESEA